jgi:hypothetical protein
MVMERTWAPVLEMPGGTVFNSGWGNSGLWAGDTVVGRVTPGMWAFVCIAGCRRV